MNRYRGIIDLFELGDNLLTDVEAIVGQNHQSTRLGCCCRLRRWNRSRFCTGADVALGTGADVACGTAVSDPHAASSKIRTAPIARIAVDLIMFEWFLPEIFEIYLLAVRKWPENLKKISRQRNESWLLNVIVSTLVRFPPLALPRSGSQGSVTIRSPSQPGLTELPYVPRI